MVTIASQVYVFLGCIFGGLIVGLLFDVFRLSRRFFNTRDIITYIQDIIFWILVGIIVLLTIFYSNNGQIRGYVFLGIVLGTVFYFLLFSKLIITTLTYIIETLIRMTSYIIKIISVPVRIAAKIFKVPLEFLIKRLIVLGRILLNVLKRLKEWIFKFKRIQKIIKEKV